MTMTNIYFDEMILVIGLLSIINSLFGISTICLIFLLRLPPNFYRTVLITMTILEICYDLFLILFFCHESNEICIDIRGVGIVVCGLGASFWSNIMVFMVLYVVFKKKIFPMNQYFCIITIIIAIISIVNGYWLMFTGAQELAYIVYNFFYISSILFNVLAYGAIQYHLHKMDISSSSSGGSVNVPIKVLANRLALYPLMQAASRFGPLWYLLQTGNTLADYKDEDNPSTMHTIAVFASAVTSPCAGIGYFVIFLFIQKGAYEELVEFASLCLCFPSTSRSSDEIAAAPNLRTPLQTKISKGADEERKSEGNRLSNIDAFDDNESVSTITGYEYSLGGESQAHRHPLRLSLDSRPSTIEYLRMYEMMDDDELL